MIETSKYKFRKSQTSDNIADVINVNEPANWDKAEAELEKINMPLYSVVTKQEPVFSLGVDVIKGQVPINAKGLSAVNLIKNGNFSDTSIWTSAGLNFTIANNEVTFIASGQFGKLEQLINVIPNNYYYLVGYIKTDTNAIRLNVDWNNESNLTAFHSGSGLYERISALGISSNSIINPRINIYDSRVNSWTEAKAKYIKLINLTSMFGAGNEPTKEQCDKMFAKWFDGVCSVNDVKIKSVGKNLFDGELEIGGLDVDVTGDNVVGTTSVRSKNYIRVKPNTYYTLTNDMVYSNIIIASYDINKKFIGKINVRPFMSGSNGAYIRFRSSTNNENNLNVKYRLEEGTTATPYEPYVESLSPLPTMHSLPNGVKDEIVDGKFIKRVQEYTLKSTDITGVYTQAANIDIATIPISTLVGIKDSGIADNLATKIMTDKTTPLNNAGLDNLSNINKHYISATSFSIIMAKGTTLAQAQTALAGTKIIYQLATPIVSDLVTPLTVFPQGTISVESDSETTIPELTFEYPTNVAGVIDEVVDGVNQLNKLSIRSIEGEWTAKFKVGGTIIREVAGLPYVVQGNLCTVWLDKFINNLKLDAGSNVGEFIVDGLPFAPKGRISTRLAFGYGFTVNHSNIVVLVEANETRIKFYKVSSLTYAPVTEADLANASDSFTIQLIYRI